MRNNGAKDDHSMLLSEPNPTATLLGRAQRDPGAIWVRRGTEWIPSLFGALERHRASVAEGGEAVHDPLEQDGVFRFELR